MKKYTNKKGFGEESKIQLKWQICVGLIFQSPCCHFPNTCTWQWNEVLEKTNLLLIYICLDRLTLLAWLKNDVEVEGQLETMALVFLNLLPGLNLRQSVWYFFGSIRKHLDPFLQLSHCNFTLPKHSEWFHVVSTWGFCWTHHKKEPRPFVLHQTDASRLTAQLWTLLYQLSTGEPGLLVCKITATTPFAGYARDLQQTEKKKLHNVLKKGDLYFNSGDLMTVDDDNFIYFQDRVGDTFRWVHLLPQPPNLKM